MSDAVRPHEPVTYEHHEHGAGPGLHGTKAAPEPGDHLVPRHPSDFREGRVSNNLSFTTLLSTAA